MRLLKLSRTSRRALPGLNALKTALELLSKAGCAVPLLQAIADTSLKIIEYAEVVKGNKKESEELAKCAAEIVEAIAESCQSFNGSGPDEQCVNDAKDLHRKLVEILIRMQELTRSKGLIRRVLRRTEHKEAIASSRQDLDRAVMIFQIKGILQLNSNINNYHKLIATARVPSQDKAKERFDSGMDVTSSYRKRPYYASRNRSNLALFLPEYR